MQLRSDLPVSQGRREAWVACDVPLLPVCDRLDSRRARQYARAISEVLFVEPAAVEIDHTSGTQQIHVRGRVEARAAARFATDSTVSCGVPGHDRAGYEVVMDKLEVTGGGFDFVFEGRCGFAATFDYRSD